MRNQLGTANTGLELAAMIAGAELYVVEISLVCGDLRSKNISFDDDDQHGTVSCFQCAEENFLDQSFSLEDCSPVLTPREVRFLLHTAPAPSSSSSLICIFRIQLLFEIP